MVTKLNKFFQVQQNVIYKQARFSRRIQKEGELEEQFFTSLYNLVKTCDLGDLKNEMTHDRIVAGIWDQALSERLQTVVDLTLEKAKTLVKQREAAHEHQLALNGSSKVDTSLDSVQKLCKQVLSIPGARVTFQRRTKAHHPRTQQLSVQNVAAVLIQDTCATSKVTTVHSAFRSQSERSAIRQSPWTTSPF